MSGFGLTAYSKKKPTRGKSKPATVARKMAVGRKAQTKKKTAAAAANKRERAGRADNCDSDEIRSEDDEDDSTDGLFIASTSSSDSDSVSSASSSLSSSSSGLDSEEITQTKKKIEKMKAKLQKLEHKKKHKKRKRLSRSNKKKNVKRKRAKVAEESDNDDDDSLMMELKYKTKVGEKLMNETNDDNADKSNDDNKADNLPKSATNERQRAMREKNKSDIPFITDEYVVSIISAPVLDEKSAKGRVDLAEFVAMAKLPREQWPSTVFFKKKVGELFNMFKGIGRNTNAAKIGEIFRLAAMGRVLIFDADDVAVTRFGVKPPCRACDSPERRTDGVMVFYGKGIPEKIRQQDFPVINEAFGFTDHSDYESIGTKNMGPCGAVCTNRLVKLIRALLALNAAVDFLEDLERTPERLAQHLRLYDRLHFEAQAACDQKSVIDE